jgi:hypothetical protein
MPHARIRILETVFTSLGEKDRQAQGQLYLQCPMLDTGFTMGWTASVCLARGTPATWARSSTARARRPFKDFPLPAEPSTLAGLPASARRWLVGQKMIGRVRHKRYFMPCA